MNKLNQTGQTLLFPLNYLLFASLLSIEHIIDFTSYLKYFGTECDSLGRGYFASLRMTSRRNNVRDVVVFAIFTDKERKKS